MIFSENRYTLFRIMLWQNFWFQCRISRTFSARCGVVNWKMGKLTKDQAVAG
jgi:hypothetical protein